MIRNRIKKRTFVIVYWCIRIGMGLTFISSGIRKFPGIKFTSLPVENQIGSFFNAMYNTGLYWNFIGYLQLAIGILIFFNRTVVISTVLMMPITVNIFLISISLNMVGTPITTSLMVLGNLFLLFWQFENYKTLFVRPI